MTTIELDNNATTRPDDAVIEAVAEALRRWWHNPSSVHRSGQAVRQQVELARESVATLIGCPVMLATARRLGDARYRVESEPLYAGGRVPRGERDKRVTELVERYAGYLERCCLRAPYQWFNFFEYWEDDAEA